MTVLLRNLGLGLLCLSLTLLAAASPANTSVTLETNLGNITIELYADKAPLSVANFLRYVDEGFYRNTQFHRVIPKFMIQGGGWIKQGNKKDTNDAIKNEAHNGLKNIVGSVAMARTNVVDSATSQFFINVGDNGFLNHKSKSKRDYGYAVFGQVTAGMDVVAAIESQATGPGDWPIQPITITKAYRD